MRNIISAIIIDKDKDNHDYSHIKTEKIYSYDEEYFDLKVLTSTEHLHEILNEFKGYDCILTIGDENIWGELNHMPFEVRKKWSHLKKFDAKEISQTIMNTFLGNIGRKRAEYERLFSIFTCTFNTPRNYFYRLYDSLCKQSYNNWNWWILDDSTTDNKNVENFVSEINDYRVHLIKNVSHHGNIGYNKHIIASICDGDYLVEVDHDDELTSNCLEELYNAFLTYSDSDFVYSDACEIINNDIIVYDAENDTWGEGEGFNTEREINGQIHRVSCSPYITPYSIRSIHLQPNHVRCWKKEFYHSIDGHNYDLSVLDDMEILVRTFLHGKMTKIDKVLYIQHEGEGERGKNATSTQSVRFAEIQRTDSYLKWKYDLEIHNRILELGFQDTAWNENGYSVLWNGEKHNVNNIMCNIV